MGFAGGWEWVIILLVVVLLFGGKKIPELAKGLGKGIKDFKKAMNEDEVEVKAEAKKELEEKKEVASDSTKEAESVKKTS